jgi:hypothetical protein
MLGAYSEGNRSMNSIRKYTLAFLLWLPITAVIGQEDLAIKELMSDAELVATGVGTLSAVQQEALSAWLIKFQLDATRPRQTPAIAAEPEQAQPAVEPADKDEDWRRRDEKIDFVSRIVGDFSGWDGNTQFNLENHQVWVQRRPSRWKIELQTPEVRIYQTLLGAFEMEVIETGRSIGVRRVR